MLNNILQLKKILGKKVILNEPLSEHTTLAIGGPARLFTASKKEAELKKLVQLAVKYRVPFLVIGGGSDILVSDEGFEGFVIKNDIKGIEIINNKIRVKSGTILQQFINFLIEKGCMGMEKMSGIPGTVGGAIYGNAGAYGQIISDYLLRVKFYDGKKEKWLDKKECEFKYRESIFKRSKGIILEAEFKFEKGIPEFLKKVSLNTISTRSQKYPSGMRCPGSFYKNVIAEDVKSNIISRIPPDKIVYGKIPAGYLMEAVGAKGQQKGSIKIADYHGNLIVNLGKGNASDFVSLAEEYAKKVESKFGIKLEPEVQLVGFSENVKK